MDFNPRHVCILCIEGLGKEFLFPEREPAYLPSLENYLDTATVFQNGIHCGGHRHPKKILPSLIENFSQAGFQILFHLDPQRTKENFLDVYGVEVCHDREGGLERLKHMHASAKRIAYVLMLGRSGLPVSIYPARLAPEEFEVVRQKLSELLLLTGFDLKEDLVNSKTIPKLCLLAGAQMSKVPRKDLARANRLLFEIYELTWLKAFLNELEATGFLEDAWLVVTGINSLSSSRKVSSKAAGMPLALTSRMQPLPQKKRRSEISPIDAVATISGLLNISSRRKSRGRDLSPYLKKGLPIPAVVTRTSEARARKKANG